MPDSRCKGSATCLHDLAGSREEDDLGCEFEESDPSGRYIRYKEILGRGAFKTVYRGFDEVDGIEVAWNQVKLQDVLRSADDLERLYSEVHLLKMLKHRNIIKFYHSWVDTGAKNINFITEIFTSGTLRQYRKRHKHVDIKAVKNWSRQILRGLLYLHSHDPPIIHRDLKCDNIFINGNQGEVKIGDLGLAAILRQAHAAHSVIGTPEFMAPELYEEEYTELADIYSFGMCLLEMVTFEYPYSECNNAAQIYKKVTSGQKPAALYKVKDPELRQFVEKCLATASRRLPARELLMDPFLQSDGDRDPVDSGPGSNRMAMDSDDMDRLGVFLSRSFPDASVFHGEQESSNLLDVCEASTPPVPRDSANSPLCEYKSLMNQVRVSPTFDAKEDKKGRNMDLRLKGKRRENDTVYLRLRIADSEGQVRIIHFPFDVESDTAMCVASEMVEELDLADQDVTKIAEMIDAAILLMVPEWRPGVAIEEPATDGPNSGGENSYRDPSYSDLCCSHCSSGHFSTMSSENSLIEQLQHGAASWHDSTKAIPPDVTLPQHAENTMHGRFEEVLYHYRRHDGSAYVMKHHTVDTESSKESGGWDRTDELNFPASRLRKTGSRAFYETDLQTTFSMETFGSISRLTSQAQDDGEAHISLSNDLVDVNAKVVNKDLNLEDFLAVADYHAGFDDSDNTDNLVMQELKELALSYERELRELRQKHEAALLALRRRWQDNKAPQMQQQQSYLCNGEASCCPCNSQSDKHSEFKQNCPVDQVLSTNRGPFPPCLVCMKEPGLFVADARLSKDTCFKSLSRDRGSERNILCNVQGHENMRGEGLLDSSAGVLFLPSRFQKFEQVGI